jgi:hypothetical protein
MDRRQMLSNLIKSKSGSYFDTPNASSNNVRFGGVNLLATKRQRHLTEAAYFPTKNKLSFTQKRCHAKKTNFDSLIMCMIGKLAEGGDSEWIQRIW